MHSREGMREERRPAVHSQDESAGRPALDSIMHVSAIIHMLVSLRLIRLVIFLSNIRLVIWTIHSRFSRHKRAGPCSERCPGSAVKNASPHYKGYLCTATTYSSRSLTSPNHRLVLLNLSPIITTASISITLHTLYCHFSLQ